VLRPVDVSPRLLRRLLLMSAGEPFPSPLLERRVLFVCVENACRSLMAEAMFNWRAPEGWVAISAGTSPALSASPRTTRMLQELGLDLPNHAPTLLTPEMIESSRIRVTMGCLDSESCPARLRDLEYRDWALPDPAPLDDTQFRQLRDQLRAKVEGLVREIRLSDRQRETRARAK
jgi:arsenate reductase